MIPWAALLGCDGDPGPPPTGPEGEPGIVATPDPGSRVGWPDAAIGPDGRVWATWASVDEEENTVLYLAVSEDGVGFEPPVVLEAGPLFLGTVRQPVIAVDEARVAVTVGGGSYLESSVLLFLAPVDDPAAFERVEIDAAVFARDVPSDTITLVDQPEVGIDDAGAVWVTWKRLTAVEAVSFALAREDHGFVIEPLDDGVRGQPCECCPVDLHLRETDRPLMTFRNNDRNIRDIYLLDVEGHRSAPVSSEPWRIGGCPFDGPALAVTDGAMIATWVDGTQGDNYAFASRSEDGGQTWSDATRLFAPREESMTWPTAAVDADGAVWISAEAIYVRTRLARSTDGGRTFAEVPLDGSPLFTAELAAGAGRTGLIGVREEDGALVYTEDLGP